MPQNIDPLKSTQTADLIVKQLRLMHGISDSEEIPPEIVDELMKALHKQPSPTAESKEVLTSSKEKAKAKLIAEIKKTNSDIDGVVNCFSEGAGPNTVDPETNESILQLACKKVDVQLVATLLNKGAGVLFKGAKGRTALHEAARYSNPLILDLLLEHGAVRYINEPDENGNTPLLEVCKRVDQDQSKIIQTLLNQGASLLDTNNDGETTLILATQNDNSQLIDLALHARVDPDSIDAASKTALCYAYEQQNQAVFNRLYPLTSKKSSTLLAATQRSDLAMIRRLKRENIVTQFHLRDDYEKIISELTNIMKFTDQLSKDRILGLIDDGLDPDTEFKHDYPKYLLDLAILNQDLEFFKALINKGATKFSYDSTYNREPSKRTNNLLDFIKTDDEFLELIWKYALEPSGKFLVPVYYAAASKKDFETAGKIIRRVNYFSELRNFFLNELTLVNDPEIVKLITPLVDSEKDISAVEDKVYRLITDEKPDFELAKALASIPNLFDSKNCSAWDHILFRILFPRIDWIGDDGYVDTIYNDVKLPLDKKFLIAQFIIDYGVNVNETEYDGNKLIHYAISKSDYKTLEFLLKNGAGIEYLVSNKEGISTEFPAYHEGSMLDQSVGRYRVNYQKRTMDFSLPVLSEEGMRTTVELIRQYYPNFTITQNPEILLGSRNSPGYYADQLWSMKQNARTNWRLNIR